MFVGFCRGPVQVVVASFQLTGRQTRLFHSSFIQEAVAETTNSCVHLAEGAQMYYWPSPRLESEPLRNMTRHPVVCSPRGQIYCHIK